MIIATWVLAGIVSLIHLLSGLAMLAKSDGKLPRNAERAIGTVAILGAVGIIVPKLTGIAPWLSPMAAFCFVAYQIGGAIFHIRRNEAKLVPLNVAMMIAAAFVGVSWSLDA